MKITNKGINNQLGISNGSGLNHNIRLVERVLLFNNIHFVIAWVASISAH